MKTRIKNLLKRIYRKLRPPIPQENTASPIQNSPPPEAPAKAPPPVPEPSVPDIHIEITETPNPNACKYDLPRQISAKAFSFSSNNPPTDHALAEKILSFPEVSSIFGVGNFITITKTQDSTWETIHPKIEACLKTYIAQQE